MRAPSGERTVPSCVVACLPDRAAGMHAVVHLGRVSSSQCVVGRITQTRCMYLLVSAGAGWRMAHELHVSVQCSTPVWPLLSENMCLCRFAWYMSRLGSMCGSSIGWAKWVGSSLLSLGCAQQYLCCSRCRV